jgi:hypothetical protein
MKRFLETKKEEEINGCTREFEPRIQTLIGRVLSLVSKGEVRIDSYRAQSCTINQSYQGEMFYIEFDTDSQDEVKPSLTNGLSHCNACNSDSEPS